MILSSSSTSSSDPPRRELRRIALVVAATACALAVLDIAINVFFAMPEDRRNMPSSVQRYFDYGRSVEGKLRYLVREADDTSGPIVTAGWLAQPYAQPAEAATPQGRLFAFYGQSMSHRIGRQIAELDNRVTLRLQGGPGAPLPHSYELFRRDRGQHRAHVVVLGVVASGLRALTSMTTMCFAFEVPAPYTYPRWIIEDGKLKSIQPVIQSLPELRQALREPDEWRRFIGQLRQYDASYSAIVFEAGVADRSALLRAARRGFGQRHQNEVSSRYHTAQGFHDTDGIVSVARAILLQFATEARADGALPVVLLLHDRGYRDDLYRAVSPTLIENEIAFVSSHDLAPAHEASSYLPDGHFRREFDIQFAKRVLALVKRDETSGRLVSSSGF